MALRLLHLSPERNTDRDVPRILASVFTEACMQIGFILATLTCLRSILRPFHSGFLITTVDTSTSGYKTGVRGRKGSEYLMLSAVKDSGSTKPAGQASVVDQSGSAPAHANGPPAQPPKAFIPDPYGTHQSAIVGHGGSNGSRDSQQMFINKTQTWTVEYEESTRGRATSMARCSSDEGHEHA